MEIEKVSKGSIFLLSELKKDYKAIMKNFLFELTQDEMNEFKKNINNISEALRLAPNNFMYTVSETKKIKKSVLEQYPIISETIKKIEKYIKENVKKFAYSSMETFLIIEMYNLSESDDAEPYLLQFYGREYGGGGCGGDCTYELQPILLKLNENQVKIYQNVTKFDANKDTIFKELKALNFKEKIIKKIIDIIFDGEDDNCHSLFDDVTFELVKLEEDY